MRHQKKLKKVFHNLYYLISGHKMYQIMAGIFLYIPSVFNRNQKI